MRKRIDDAILFDIDTRRDLVSVDILACKRCPLCLTSFNGEYMTAALIAGKFPNLLYVTHYCASCERVFLGVYHEEDSVRSRKTFKSISCIPKSDLEKNWPTEIRENFPEFISIYNEALQAELQKLTQVCGMAYRKALEFLVKDYLIKFTDNNEEDVNKMPLGQCIKSIDNPKIRTVASRSAWLGNDHSHYHPKFEEYDLSDLKKLIEAVAYWISVEIITLNAEEIQPR